MYLINNGKILIFLLFSRHSHLSDTLAEVKHAVIRTARNTLYTDTDVPNNKLYLVWNYLTFKDIYLCILLMCYARL